MSSNIGPEAQAAYNEYLNADTIEEKIQKLEKYLSLVPKHKATENIVALNKTRLAKLRRELEKKKKREKSQKGVVSPFSIKKEGTQLILVSDYYTPGAGKTSLLHFLTGAAEDKIGRFTATPEIGIYKDIGVRFQIVDMPSIMENAHKGVGNGKEILAQLRATDLLCICVDLTRDIENQMELILNEFRKAEIRINESPPPIKIKKTGANKIQVFFLTNEAKEKLHLTDQIKEIVRESGIRNCIVRIYDEINLRQLADALNPSVVYKKAIIFGTKGDLPHTEERFQELKDKYSDKFPLIFGVSVKKGIFPKDFGKKVVKFLGKIKIYTMTNGKVSDKPLLVDKGGTIEDVARKIHKSFVEKFEFAVVVREGARIKRKRVGLDYPIQDNDKIEIHTI
ncbi:MAG: TGS domain-containing protein [Promethearchaeia archaeon]